MDEIVSTVSHEGRIYIFTRDGRIYEMARDSLTGQLLFRLLIDLFPRG